MSSDPRQPGPRRGAHIEKRHGANLPHWRRDGATYAVTFRLADSLPAAVLLQWEAERSHFVSRAAALGRPLSEFELARLNELYSERIEKWLDQGHGSCALRDAAIASLVSGAIGHFDGERYDLMAWCVMPNHVHVVVTPRQGFELSRILLSWKGFTGKRINELRGTVGRGEFWQKESYDHLIRDADDLRRQVAYVVENPDRAGLRNWPWVWKREGPGG